MIWALAAFVLGVIVGRVSERSRRRSALDVRIDSVNWVRRERGKR